MTQINERREVGINVLKGVASSASEFVDDSSLVSICQCTQLLNLKDVFINHNRSIPFSSRHTKLFVFQTRSIRWSLSFPKSLCIFFVANLTRLSSLSSSFSQRGDKIRKRSGISRPSAHAKLNETYKESGLQHRVPTDCILPAGTISKRQLLHAYSVCMEELRQHAQDSPWFHSVCLGVKGVKDTMSPRQSLDCLVVSQSLTPIQECAYCARDEQWNGSGHADEMIDSLMSKKINMI